MSEVIIYTKTGCPYCQAAIERYQKDGIPFREVNVGEDPKALQFIKESYGAQKVPVIVSDGSLVCIGFQGGG
ncbi:glutaredoxin family protein [Dethiobacter alkaliphilus]|uniref:Glutaredoxin n=1 Tax=Dethiobacter alkaliphilus AHT 1 TaxID=555088 RepID=C0GKR0_DETAL|nr:glutaredoxin family protein [Dethiobacter alkaliphilus]EEG76082.1 glutaredoxin [Dethiobacter alkaliphilus AHT 1]